MIARTPTFKPACRSNQLQRCTAEEIRNAYDNTIACTYYVIERPIALLDAASEQVLIYVSDHGESLGGRASICTACRMASHRKRRSTCPCSCGLAPGYEKRAGLRPGCLRSRSAEPISHDNLYHTVLGVMAYATQVYGAQRNFLATCPRCGRIRRA